MARRYSPRVSQSVRVGPFRLRVSVPLGRGRTWVSAGTGTRAGWTSAAVPLGGRRRRR